MGGVVWERRARKEKKICKSVCVREGRDESEQGREDIRIIVVGQEKLQIATFYDVSERRCAKTMYNMQQVP